MKKLHLIILLLSVAMSSLAQTVGEAFYIYRNDGEFNAFFRDEVDSIAYSNYDTDSIYFDEAVMQVVYTQDSIYRIPLAAIDSVRFRTPEKKYATGVRKIDELVPYITAVDGMVFHLSPKTPTNLIPKKNDVLLYEDFKNEMFPLGFAGRVTETGYVVTCDSVALDEIYEQLICFGEFALVRDEGKVASRYKLVPKHVEQNIPLSLHFGASLTKSDIGKISVEGELGTNLKFIYRQTKYDPLYIEMSSDSYVNFSFDAGVMKEFEGDLFKGVKMPNWLITPIPGTPFFFSMKGRPSLQWNFKGGFTFSGESMKGYKFGYKYCNGQHNWYCTDKYTKCGVEPGFYGNVSGSIFAGVVFEPSVDSPGGILSITPETKAGAELSLESQFNLSDEDDDYSTLKNWEVNLDVKLDVEGKAKWNLFGWKNWEFGVPLLSAQMNVNSWKLVPSFSAPSIDATSPTKATISVVPDEKLLPPGVTIGLGIWDENGEKVGISSCPDKYREISEWPLERFQTTFENLIPGNEYKVYPIVWWGGEELIASPYTSFTTASSFPAKILRVEQDGADFYREGFDYKGKIYHYDFACTTTIELKNDEGVEDWGYVYKDPDGDTIHISVKGLGNSTYADSRYNYYRNEPKSTTTLFGYVKYRNGKYIYDEPMEYDLLYVHKPSGYVKDAFEVTTTSAQFEYGFDDVPLDAKCFVAVQTGNRGTYSSYAVTDTAKDTLAISDLQPSTTYTYWAYVEYDGKTYSAPDGKKSFTTKAPPTPIATTGDVSKITKNSANVSCTYANVPDKGVCGVVYKWKDGTAKQTAKSSNGAQNITLSGLASGTTYTYCAYIEANGQTYYGEDKTFTTEAVIPDIAGEWYCTEYNEDGSQKDKPYKITLFEDHTAKSERWGYDDPGKWSIDSKGQVSIRFEWNSPYRYAYHWHTFGGTVNDLFSPSRIEGTKTEATQVADPEYHFIMTR